MEFLDSVSFLMIFLTLLIFLIVKFSSKMIFFLYKKEILIYMLIMFLLLSFYSFSFFYFYLFFELSTLPIFFYIYILGKYKNKVMASLYILFFTFLGALIFSLSLLYLWHQCKSIENFMINFLSLKDKFAFIMILVFFIKMPVFFFHIWLPLAHVESPMLGSMVLASLLLKLGTYGIYRLSNALFYSLIFLKEFMYSLGIVGASLVSVICIFQNDLKKSVAFSSVSHMTLILTSIFSMIPGGLVGSIMIMLSHGFISSGMFLGLGSIYYRLFTRNVYLMKSNFCSPNFSFWWFLIISLNLSFPPFLSFLSELLIFFSSISFEVFSLIFIVFLIMATSIYSVNLIIFLTSSLKEKFFFWELFVLENLIFAFHIILPVLFIFSIWMI